MATVGGDCLELRVNHPVLGEHVFYPKAYEGFTFDPGGIRTNDDVNQVSGDGLSIYQMNRVRGYLELVIANDMNTREDWTFAKRLGASPVEASFVASFINGTSWGFNGKPVGDIQVDTNAATFTMKIAFSGDPNRLA